jgi:hypothetical protein
VDTPAERNAAYAEFLAGLADLREDVATGRFDALIAALEADGRLERGEAARLRYWQRESLRTQADQLVSTASASLAALDRARAAAAASVASADAIWDTVSDAEPSAAAHSAPTDPTPTPSPSDDLDLTIVLVPSHDSSPIDEATPPGFDTVDTVDMVENVESAPVPPRGRHRAPAHAAPTAPEPTLDETRQEPNTPSDPVGIAPDPPARRRRLLVAGLTVVDNSDVPPESTAHPAVG